VQLREYWTLFVLPHISSRSRERYLISISAGTPLAAFIYQHCFEHFLYSFFLSSLNRDRTTILVSSGGHGSGRGGRDDKAKDYGKGKGKGKASSSKSKGKRESQAARRNRLGQEVFDLQEQVEQQNRDVEEL
jgi:hypothetical protein